MLFCRNRCRRVPRTANAVVGRFVLTSVCFVRSLAMGLLTPSEKLLLRTGGTRMLINRRPTNEPRCRSGLSIRCAPALPLPPLQSDQEGHSLSWGGAWQCAIRCRGSASSMLQRRLAASGGGDDGSGGEEEGAAGPEAAGPLGGRVGASAVRCDASRGERLGKKLGGDRGGLRRTEKKTEGKGCSI